MAEAPRLGRHRLKQSPDITGLHNPAAPGDPRPTFDQYDGLFDVDEETGGVDLSDGEADRELTERLERSRPKSGRLKFTCAGCGLNAWAKPSALLVCGTCRSSMTAA